MPPDRLAFAIETAHAGGDYALGRFRDLDGLQIESKGHQDLVSDADRQTELLVRAAIAEAFPDDGIVGEEHAPVTGTTGYDWVIDPIDGTANFVRGLPHWGCVIACTYKGLPVIGAIYDPNTGETYSVEKGGGAFLNGRRLQVAHVASLADGSVGVGAAGRADPERVAAIVRAVLLQKGLFFRSASGALMLCYVAAGRLIGYIEDHMHAWDCLAGLLLISEAGGTHLALDPHTALPQGTRVIAGAPEIYPVLQEISDTIVANS
ncbi:MAG: inositol monophosphatase [Pseudomonadota bacterium]